MTLSRVPDVGLAPEVISAIANSTPAGAVAFFAQNSAPTGWVKANGATVSRTTYASLFAAIGTTFGVGDGSTTFALPDLRGEFPRGWDDSRGVDSGRAFGSFQDQAFASHSHTHLVYHDYGYAASAPNRTTGMVNGGGGAANLSGNATGGVETRPRNVALLACIKF